MAEKLSLKFLTFRVEAEGIRTVRWTVLLAVVGIIAMTAIAIVAGDAALDWLGSFVDILFPKLGKRHQPNA